MALPEGSEVTVTPSNGTPEEAETETALEREIRWLTTRTPEEIERTREEISRTSRPPRPLPPGKTLEDVLREFWPRDETEEQVREALERLS